MSWRIVIDGYVSPNPCPDYGWADGVIRTPEEADSVAKEFAWQRPLKIFTPSLDNPLFRRLVVDLDELEVDWGDYRVFLNGNQEADWPEGRT